MTPKTSKAPSAKSATPSAKSAVPAKTKAPAKAPPAIKKNKLYDSKTQNTTDGHKRRVKVTEVKDGKVWYEPVNYTRARPAKGRPVSEATFRRDYALVVEEKKAAS
jgi:hypothetical protein